MNIFKKKIGLFQQIEQRVIQSLKQQILFAKKRMHRIYLLCLIPTASVFLFGFMSLFSKYNIFHLSPIFGILLTFLSSICTAVMISEYWDNFFSLKKCKEKMIHYNDEYYLSLFKRDKKDGFSQLNQLTEEEIRQLFDLELTTTQLDFLQKSIINDGYLNLDHLAQCPDLSVDEEKNILQEQQQKLNDFFSNHSVNKPKYQRLVDQMNDYQAQEQTLVSRL